MLVNEKKQVLDQIINHFSREEILWTSGYLSGFLTNNLVKEINNSAPKNLTIIYVSETGNSKFLANEIAKKLKEQNFVVKLKASEQYRFADFAKEQNLLLISSTHGDGEIPAAGKKFYEFLEQNKPDLNALKFFVIALGDRNYPLFCKAGKDFENLLSSLKAQKIAPSIELDLNFESQISQIYQQVSAAFGEVKTTNYAPKIIANKSEFIGTVLANINLNDAGSSKQTHHLEIAVDDEIKYESGDAIGIVLKPDDAALAEKTAPRFYSIASSVNAHGNEVHLTVALLRYINQEGKSAEGLVSGYLSRLKVGDKIKFYISANRNFRLPQDDKNIIMIAAGTGIAPFRSFLSERNFRNASGKNWLFFGERNFRSDFLYQTELQDYVAAGMLRLDVAFSRDQEEKIYVQNRLLEKAIEIFEWLENGAYFYVCGDKQNMAKGVENALLEIVKAQGKKTQEQAQEFLSNLISEGRYLKDVY